MIEFDTAPLKGKDRKAVMEAEAMCQENKFQLRENLSYQTNEHALDLTIGTW